MADAAGNSLVVDGAFGTFDLIGNPAYRLSTGASEKWDLGAPEPDIAVLVETLLNGDRVSGNRSGNRQITLPLLLTATDRLTLADNLNGLLRTVDCQPPNESFTLTWTPAGGLPVIYTCYRGKSMRTRSLLVENAGASLALLTFAAAPFGRSDATETIAAPSPQLQLDSFNTAPTGATLDTGTKYEGTGSGKVTLTGSLVTAPTSRAYDSPAGGVHRTITSTDLTGYSFTVRGRWAAPALFWPSAGWNTTVTLQLLDSLGRIALKKVGVLSFPAGGTDWKLIQFNANATGWTHLTGDIDDVTQWRIDIHATGQSSSTATSSFYLDDLRAYPSSSTSLSTINGAVLAVPGVLGTAPAPLSLVVTHSPLTNLLLHHPPAHQDPDAQIIMALAGSPKTATVAPANNGFNGTYTIVLLISTLGSGSRTVTVTVAHKVGATTLATQSVVATYSTPTGKFAIIGEVTLPLVPVPDENVSDSVVFTVTSVGGTADTFTDLALLDTDGQLAILGALPAGTTTVYFDEPDPVAEIGQIYASATDRTAATGQLGWGAQTRIDGGPIDGQPGDNRILVASPDGLPSLSATYRAAWLDERTA